MKRYQIIAICGILLLSIFYILPTNVRAQDTLTVGPGGPPAYDFSTISEAISSANENDTIYVYSGTYTENIVIDKTITITGEGSSSTTITSGDINKNTIEINVNYVNISGFKIRNLDLSGSRACIKLYYAENCRILNNFVENAGNGVYLVSSNSNTIDGNTIQNNNIGIYLSNANSNTIKSNNIKNNNANGVFAASTSSGNLIYLNDFSDNTAANAVDLGSNNWDYNSQGNYWDDYNDYDTNGDGVGDNPYVINEDKNYKDNFPLGDFLSLNQQPIAYIDSISPSPASEGQSVSFSGHGTDDGTGGFVYEWKSNLEGILSRSATFSTSSLLEGTHSISFRVQDDEGQWSAYVYQTLVISSNQKPSAFILKPTESTKIYGNIIEFLGYGTDPDGDVIIGYMWRSEPTGVSSTSSSFTMSNLPVGSYIIYFKVKDNRNEWSSEVTKTLTILPDTTVENNPPVADANGPYDGFVNQSVSFDGSYSYDPNTEDVLTYLWDFGDGSTVSGVSVEHVYVSEGKYTVNLTVVDEHGLQSRDTTYADIAAIESPQNNTQDDKKTPGFEIITIIFTLSLIVIYNQYKRKKKRKV